MVCWLYELYFVECEGVLLYCFMQLVSGVVCVEIVCEIDVCLMFWLNKQGCEDGLFENDNLFGDVVEVFICVLYFD